MRASLALPLCALAVLPATLGAPSAQADPGHEGGHQDRVKRFTLTTVNSQGEFPNITADLVNRHGEEVGFVATNCVGADSVPPTETCWGSYVLRDG
ncbi:hypothetical protein AAH978_21875, partial [Streptomyces sp. ZYX-F-203]